MWCVNQRWLILDTVGGICLSYQECVYVTPRPGRDVMRAWGCIASVVGLPLPRTDCQVPQTSLICTSTELSPCSEHLVLYGSSAVVLGLAVRS